MGHTARGISESIVRFLPFPTDEVIASGGGTANAAIMKHLKTLLGEVPESKSWLEATVKKFEDHLLPAVLAPAFAAPGSFCATAPGALPWPEAV